MFHGIRKFLREHRNGKIPNLKLTYNHGIPKKPSLKTLRFLDMIHIAHQPLFQYDSCMSNLEFKPRVSVEQVEESTELAPKFDENGLIAVVTTDYTSGELLMHGYMNEEAFRKTLELGEAVYYSRSRKCIWHKGATSGLVQIVKAFLIDDDQDAVWLRVEVKGGGASCHVGYRSCFYRSVPFGQNIGEDLVFTESEKVFDPKEVYGDAPNPTQL